MANILIGLLALQMDLREICDLARKDKRKAALELLKKEKRCQDTINRIFEYVRDLQISDDDMVCSICEI